MTNRVIRNSVFETNSSSTHSIHIDNECDILDTASRLINNKNELVLTGGEFGWEWTKFNDTDTKLNYIGVFVTSIERTKRPKGEKTKLFENVVKKQLKVKKIIYNFCSQWGQETTYSYIDHQSFDQCRSIWQVFENEQNMRCFLFSEKSWLFLGNDNDRGPLNFYITPQDVIIGQVTLQGVDQPFLLKKGNNIHDALYHLFQSHPLNDNELYQNGHWDISRAAIGPDSITIQKFKYDTHIKDYRITNRITLNYEVKHSTPATNALMHLQDII